MINEVVLLHKGHCSGKIAHFALLNVRYNLNYLYKNINCLTLS